VKQSDLGAYEENAREKQKIQVYRINHQLPSNQAIWMANTNFPPQISKLRRIKGFGEDIGQLSLGVYVSHLYIFFLYMVSQEVVSSLNMSHLFVEDRIFGYRDGTGVITHEETFSNLTPKSLMVCIIQRIYEQ
jgi:hypothetical protein